MAEDIVMPRLSDSMEEGTVLKWMKSVGDEVALGDELVEIETDKANMVFEADAAGTLIEIIAGEGDTLPIGEVIARVGDASEAADGGGGDSDGGGADGAKGPSDRPRVPAADSPEDPPPAPAAPEEGAPAVAASDAPAASRGDGNGRVKASPIARRIARERGVELSALSGSGPGGRIVKADVEAAPSSLRSSNGRDGPGPSPAQDPLSAPAQGTPAEAPETAKGTVETLELTKLQQTVSRRM
ncbi:MAG: biotin/lipoyl-containing protein, partial [Solirubrobacterales bacterium]